MMDNHGVCTRCLLTLRGLWMLEVNHAPKFDPALSGLMSVIILMIFPSQKNELQFHSAPNKLPDNAGPIINTPLSQYTLQWKLVQKYLAKYQLFSSPSSSSVP